jgi:hypothetical protein
VKRRIGTTPKSGARRCPTGKTRFRDHESATTALQITQRSSRTRKPTRAYRCDLCDGWHLTSKGQR